MKESNDELNPNVVTSGTIAPTRKRKTVGDYVALAIATCGVGYSPIAPGTMGSLVGVGIYLFLRPRVIEVFMVRFSGRVFDDAWRIFAESSFFTCVLLIVIVGLSLVGIWAASRAERLFGRKDPGAVVIDEVVGQLITYAMVPHFIGPIGIVLGFVLFRAFDIIKPYPIRNLEKLPSGLGIVVDDIAAGFYAGTALAIISTLFFLHILQ
jgi:phosphatidylglycerophosphatase A